MTTTGTDTESTVGSETLVPRGLINDVIPFSCVDGPGNRFVVFLQGCNLNCIACHNPDTITVCNDCGECVAQCPSGALTIDPAGHVRWDTDTCTGSDACTAWCPYDSTPKATLTSVADLLERIRGAAPFLSGVTVSGGEATQQTPFVHALFRALSADPALARLSRFVDSNGVCSRQVWDDLDPVLDGAMIDLKAIDDDVHVQMTGSSNAAVLDSIRLLASRDKLYEVRLLMVPGVNDSPDQIARAAAWLTRIDPWMRVVVIGFRCHGVRQNPLLAGEPTPEDMARYQTILHAEGVHLLRAV